MSITVRPASPADVPWLLEQLQQFAQFFGSARSLFPTMDYAETVLRGLIADQTFLVADNDRGPVGFIAGFVTPHALNPAITVMSELFWWVVPDARGSRAGAALLTAFLAIAKDRAHWIVMTLEAESPINPATLLARGFRVWGTNGTQSHLHE